MIEENKEEVQEREEGNLKTVGGYNDGNLTRATNDDIFASEFNTMMTYRRNNGGATNSKFTIPSITIPNLSKLLENTHNTFYARVLNIEEPYYDTLNNNLVEVLKDRTIKQRKALNNGTFRKDEDGKVALFDYHLESDSYAIRSLINIHKSNYQKNEDGSFVTDRKGNKVRYTETKGFGYIDYEVENNKRYFIYSIPKKYLYKANMTALVLSVHKHPSSYYGYKIAFVNGMYYYLCVINYKREQNDNTTRILGISNKVDYRPEINEILQYWQGIGKYKGQSPYIFNMNLTKVPYASGNIANNIGCMYFRGKLTMENFESRSVESFDTNVEDINGDD